MQEAKDTGGTVNPFEVTQAVTQTAEPSYSRPKNSPSSRPRGPNLRFRAQGGIVSINDIIGRI